MVDSAPVQSQTEPTPVQSKGSFTDHLANERTFLAWTRTSLGIFALGCAIARFGGSNNTQTTRNNSFHEMKPMLSGLLLATCGILTLFYGIYRYYRINRQIIDRNLSDVSQIREPIIATLILLLTMIAILVVFVIL